MSRFIINLSKSAAIVDAYKLATNGTFPNLSRTSDPLLLDIIADPDKYGLTADDVRYTKIIDDNSLSTITDYDELPVYLGDAHYLSWDCVDIKPVIGQDKRELDFIDFAFLFNLYENISQIIFADYFNEWHDKSHLFAELTGDNRGYIYIFMDKTGSTLGYHNCISMQIYYHRDRRVLEDLAMVNKRDIDECSDYNYSEW